GACLRVEVPGGSRRLNNECNERRRLIQAARLLLRGTPSTIAIRRGASRFARRHVLWQEATMMTDTQTNRRPRALPGADRDPTTWTTPTTGHGRVANRAGQKRSGSS